MASLSVKAIIQTNMPVAKSVKWLNIQYIVKSKCSVTAVSRMFVVLACRPSVIKYSFPA